MIHGVVRDGTILPLDPIPDDWNQRRVAIEATVDVAEDQRKEIAQDLRGLGSGRRTAWEKYLRM